MMRQSQIERWGLKSVQIDCREQVRGREGYDVESCVEDHPALRVLGVHSELSRGGREVFLQDLEGQDAAASSHQPANQLSCLVALSRVPGVVGVDQDVGVDELTTVHATLHAVGTRGRS